MNIFVVDLDPRTSARSLCDKHVWKMHTESVQLLVSLANNFDVAHYIVTKDGSLHKGGYPHHPCCQWLGESIENVEWLLEHAFELCFEHQRRMLTKGREIMPFSYSQLNDWIGCVQPWMRRHLPRRPLTPFPQCMPEQYRGPDVVEAYRRYYHGDKVRIAKWKYCDPPRWWTESLSLLEN